MAKAKTDPRPAAFITGAGQGIGAEIALRLAIDGHDVALGWNSKEPREVVAKIEATGARAVPVKLDIRSQPDIAAGIGKAAEALGGLDVLVNNAGVTLRQLAIDVTPDEWQTVLDCNLTGTFFMCQHMARHLLADKRPGCIVNIASTHGVVALAQRSTYGISKAGIIHMTRMLAYEWAEHGIRVNAVAPGLVETPSRAEYFGQRPDARQAMVERVPMGRFASEQDVAGAVAYLVSADSGYVTGHTLMLDGGLTAY